MTHHGPPRYAFVPEARNQLQNVDVQSKEEDERTPSTIDSNGDGSWDIEEDLNQSNRVDHGETDPNVVANEQNSEWFSNFYLIRWMPQVHWQACFRFQLQAGFGLRHLEGHNSGEGALRAIVEF